VSDACGPRKENPFLLPLSALALAALCATRQLQAIFHLPVDPQFADMLPLVRSALASFWSGEQPYRTYSFPWPLPLTFLPGLWLSYTPAWLAGLDLRLFGLVFGTLLLGRLAGLSARPGGAAAWLVLLLLATGSKFTDFARVGHLPLYWLLLVLFAEDWLASRRRAALWLGLLLGMRQTAWLLLPPVALHLWISRGEPSSRRAGLAALGMALGLAGLLIVPFLLGSPRAFVGGTIAWYGSLGGLVVASDPLSVIGQPGVGGLFYTLGAASLLPAFVLGAVLLCWCSGPPGAAGALGRGALALAAFSLGSAPCWWYSLLDPLLLLAVLQASPAPVPRERLWRRAALAASAASAAARIGLSWPHVEALHFDQDSVPRLVEGFYGPEHWGPRTMVWAREPRAEIALPRLRPFTGELFLVLRPAPGLGGSLDIDLNGEPLASLHPAAQWAVYRFRLGPGRLVLGNNSLVLRGQVPERSQTDPRPLLAALDELRLVEDGGLSLSPTPDEQTHFVGAPRLPTPDSPPPAP
jgi:hypothetical protein